MPSIAVAILNRLADAELSPYFRVVGTHALYAYEAAAGVHFASQVTTTRDIDLLWDTRKRVAFAQTLAKDSPSMLAALQKVDKTFQIPPDQKYTAINQNGYEVDILRRMAKEDDLLNAPAFSEIVVAENGTMARMHTLHPAAFVQFKRWLVKQPDRDPVKRRRDALQADAVEWVLQERLPHLQM